MNIKIIEPRYLAKRFNVGSLTPSLGPIIIGTLLKEQGHQVEVISEYVTAITQEEMARIDRADLIGISITTYNATRGFEIAESLRVPVVFGGFHASLAPEECLEHGDYVIRGDGHPVVLLANCLEKGTYDEIQQIPNLVYRRNGETIFNARDTKALNVAPDFTIVKDYCRPGLRTCLRMPLLMNASRGCSRNCSFCSIKKVFSGFEKKNQEIVIQDLKNQVKNRPFLSRFFPKVIWITDDNFFSDRDWAKEMLRALARNKTHYRLNIQVHASIAEDDELLKLMKEANVEFVSVGIESLNPGSLNNFRKGLTPENIIYAIKKMRYHGISVHGLFIFGDDEFKKGDGRKVAAFARKQKLSGILIQPLTPFPGTELFDRLQRQGRILHRRWGEYGDKVVFVPEHMSPRELQEEICNCYAAVYSPLGTMRAMLHARKGFRILILGIALFRQLEIVKLRKYIRAAWPAKNSIQRKGRCTRSIDGGKYDQRNKRGLSTNYPSDQDRL